MQENEFNAFSHLFYFILFLNICEKKSTNGGDVVDVD